MRCEEFRLHVHDYLDDRLSGRETSRFGDHLRQCRECADCYEEFLALRLWLSDRGHFPDAATPALLRRFERARLGWTGRAREAVRLWIERQRDLDWPLVICRSIAAPFALLFFLAVFFQFAPTSEERLAFVLIPASPAQYPVHAIVSFQTRPERRQLQELMDTAWRLPYEDSLSLVAEVKSEGTVEIDSVLEYPKSTDLLNAVHAALRASQLEESRVSTSRLLIFSFQKIDVYENGRGL